MKNILLFKEHSRLLFWSFVFLFAINIQWSWGQQSFTGTGSGNTYSQTFDNAGTATTYIGSLATLPANWTSSNSTYSGIYSRGNAYSATNGNFALRNLTGETEIAIGAKPAAGTPTNIIFTGANNTGAPITGFTINWNVEQYSAAATATTLDFAYNINGGSYVVTGVTGTTLVTASTLGTAANLGSITSTSRSITISGISIPNTQNFSFRFAIGGASGAQAHIGIDDFMVFASGANTAPTVSSPTAANITNNAAQLGGNVTADGGVTITERGVVYSLTTANANPEIDGAGVTKVIVGGTSGIFTTSSSITGLTPGAGYSYKAYATNSLGTTYSTVATFTTLTVPTLTAPIAAAILTDSATLGGTVTNDGGSPVTERGVVFAQTVTNNNPEIGGTGVTKLLRSGTTGVYTVGTGAVLTLGTGYSYKGYATNAFGTSYTSVDTFTTSSSALAPSVTSSPATSINTTVATLNGNVTSDGGATITERGFVFATTPGVTINNNKSTTSVGTGAFSRNIFPSVNTQYFFKAFATNSVNTTLSTPELSFWSLAQTPNTPIVGGATATQLTVTIGSDANPSNTKYAFRENVLNTPTARFVQADGTLGTTAVYQTIAAWGTINVIGLAVNAGYGFAVSAQNGDGVNTVFAGNAATVFTLANTPNAPTVGGATGTSLNVAIGSGDGNPSTTVYAIRETTSGNYVQSGGTVGTSAVYQTAATWGTRTVTGLSNATSYIFRVIARNGAGTDTSFGATASGTTLNICGSDNFSSVPTNSTSSYITRTWNNGGTWTAVARTDTNGSNAPMSGTTLTFIGAAGDVISPTIANGIGTLSFNYVRAFTSTSARSLLVFINGVQFGSDIIVDPSSNTVATYSQPINISGNVVIRIASAGNSQVSIDNISWSCYTGPIVTSNAASNIATVGADLNGTVDINGSGGTSTASFDYGLTTSYGTSTTVGTLSGTGNQAVTKNIGSLAVNTQYNYRAVATSTVDGVRNGSNVTFWTLANTPVAPTVNGATATSLNVAIAADGNPAVTTYAIQELGGQYVQSNGTLGGTAVYQTAAAWGTRTVTGLSNLTGYSFTVQARNGAGTTTSFGPAATGTTLAAAPTVTSSAATAIGTNVATLNGTVTSDGAATISERGFVYKTTAGAIITDNKTPVAGTTGAFTSNPALAVNTQYFFKAFATNSVNTTLSTPELNFWTLANTPTAPVVANPTFSSSSLTLAIGSGDGNPANTTYAIRETNSGNFVQSGGTLGASAVYQTGATWGTRTVTALTASTSYTFEVIARNGVNVVTSAGPTATGITYAAPVVIAKQDFELSPGTPILPYSAVGGTISTGTNTSGLPVSNLFATGARGYQLAGGGTATLTFDNLSLSGYKNCFITLRVAGMSFGGTGNGIDGTDYVKVAISTDGGTTNYSDELWVTGTTNSTWDFTAGTDTAINYTGANTPTTRSNLRSTYRVNIPDNLNVSQIGLKVTLNNNSGELWVIDDVNVSGTPLPAITAGTLSPTSTAVCEGYSTSPNMTFNVSGTNMQSPITITPPTNFEVSTSATFATGGGSGSAITVGAIGTIASTPVYVRLVSGLAATSYSGSVLLTAAGGAITRTVAVSATVTAAPNAGVISGTQAICSNGTTQFSTTGTGGTWSSDATGVATVNATTGLVSGMSAGSATITYTVVGTGGCTNATATRMVTVTAAPNAGTISGTQAICSNGTTQFSTTGTGGTWSSNATGVATVDATTGLVSGVSAGSATITYTVIGTGGCTNATATRMVTVTAAPNAGTVSGTQAICSNGTTQFSTTGTGGTWSSDATGVATVDVTTGLVSGVSGGIATITYTVIGTGGCSNALATRMVTVTSATTYYADADSDGFGNPAVTQLSCTQPVGYVSNNTDCNDGVFAINPGATEICWNNIDDNCNNMKSEVGCTPIPVYVNNPAPVSGLGVGTISNFATHLSAVPYTYPGATSLDYRYEITNTSVTPNQTIEFTQTGTFARYFTIPVGIRGFDTNYTIRASAVINGEEVPYAVSVITVRSTGIPTVKLSPTSCGVTLSRLNATISANPGFNATSYEFRIRKTSDNGTTPAYSYAQSLTRFIGANSFVGLSLQYNTSYSVSVRYTTPSVGTTVTPDTSLFGDECIIITPSIPLISLSSPICGSTLDRFGATISASPATYAQEYQFRVRLNSDNGSNPTYYYTIPSASRYSSLQAAQGLVLAYSTEYSVSVRYSIPVVGSVIPEWSAYGSDCVVVTPSFPTTEVSAGQCGTAVTDLNQTYTIDVYPGNPMYSVKLERIQGMSLILVGTIETATPSFKINMFSGTTLGVDYSVSVALRINGELGPYGRVCDLAAPSSARVQIAPFSVVAYPNPFSEGFQLDVKTANDGLVSIKTYDMIGRLIEERSSKVNKLESISIGANYPSGVYNVIVSQEDEIRTVRVVKR